MSPGALLLIASPFVGSWLATLAVRLPEGEPTALARSRCRSPYWKTIKSVRLSVGACGLRGMFVRLELP